MNSKYKWKGGERLMRPAKETAWNLAVRNDICCKELFPGSDIVRSYTFKTAAPRGQSALLAKLNHMLTAAFAALIKQMQEEVEAFYLSLLSALNGGVSGECLRQVQTQLQAVKK